MTTARAAEIDGSIALVISSDATDQLGLRAGDQFQIIPTSDGMTLKRCATLADRQLEVAERVMEQRRDVLRRLAE